MSKRILVIGDTSRDVFINVDATRLSPESPVPVVVPHSVRENLGMAGNVAANIAHLAPDYYVGTLFPAQPSVKTRYVDRKSNHHFVRVDQDMASTPLDEGEYLRAVFMRPDAIVLSDYNKGFLTAEKMEYLGNHWGDRIHPLAPHTHVFLDTKKLLGDWSKRIEFVKINESEFEAHLKAGILPWDYCQNLIVTRGAAGMDLYTGGRTIVYHSPGVKVEVADVVGAGDTVLAALAVNYLETGDIRAAMDWANKAGAIAVSKRGVVAVKREEVL